MFFPPAPDGDVDSSRLPRRCSYVVEITLYVLNTVIFFDQRSVPLMETVTNF